MKIQEEKKWKLEAFSDSDYGGDYDTRKSVTGYILYLYGCPISWKSRSQKNVTLSSTEAEYVALSETSIEILFVKDLMEFLEEEIDKPIRVNIDNIGAIYLSKKAGSTGRTKHVQTRYHFVREYIEDGTLVIEFVRSEENDSDIFTKNVKEEKFSEHSTKFMKNEK